MMRKLSEIAASEEAQCGRAFEYVFITFVGCWLCSSLKMMMLECSWLLLGLSVAEFSFLGTSGPLSFSLQGFNVPIQAISRVLRALFHLISSLFILISL